MNNNYNGKTICTLETKKIRRFLEPNYIPTLFKQSPCFSPELSVSFYFINSNGKVLGSYNIVFMNQHILRYYYEIFRGIINIDFNIIYFNLFFWYAWWFLAAHPRFQIQNGEKNISANNKGRFNIRFIEKLPLIGCNLFYHFSTFNIGKKSLKKNTL